MSSIDLLILGMVLERPMSAYELQKDVEAHHLSRWTKISTPSVYKKTLQLRERGYLSGERFGDKTVYSATEAGRAYFEELMEAYAERETPLTFDFNVVVANLNKLEKPRALELVSKLRGSFERSRERNRGSAAEFADIPLTGRAIIEQQGRLYGALLDWLDEFERELRQ